MATTTNYGWDTPDDTDLVKDGAAAIRTLGSSVDTTTKALNPSTTLGDIEYRSATANTNTRLGIGTTGQILTVTGGVPAWETPAAGGGMTELATGSITTTLNLTSISQDYKELVLYISDFTSGSANSCTFRINNDSGSNYYGILMQQIGANAGQFNARNGVTSIDLIANDRAANTGDNHIVLRIPNYTVSAYKLVEFSSFVTLDGGTTWGTQTGTIGYKSATAVSQLNIFGQTAGNYKLYGVN
jgi:hypothetical protein